MELFVGNCPFSATPKDIVQLLESITGPGKVLKCDIVTDESRSLRSKGYGFVMLADEDAGNRILAVADTLLLHGRQLRVNPSKRVIRKPRHEESEITGICLFMGNLASGSRLEYLWLQNEVDMKIIYTEPPAMSLFLTLDEVKYKLEFSLDSIAYLQSCNLQTLSEKGLLFQLYYPPRVYERKPLSGEDLSDKIISAFSAFGYTMERPWVRTTDFTDEKVIGQSIAFCLQFPESLSDELMKTVRKFNDYSLGDYPPSFKKTIAVETASSYAAQQDLVPIIGLSSLNTLPSDLIFKVNFMVQYGYISPTGLTAEFFSLLHPSVNPVDRSLSALATLERSRTTVWDPATKVRQYFEKESRRPTGRIVAGEGQVYVKRLIVTPTKVYCLGPEIELSNRITRSFGDHIDNFLRISFCEEDFDNLATVALSTGFGLGQTTTNVYDRIESVLQKGVRIGEMDYQFLAYSSSQLKERSVWMFSNTETTTAEDIREWMGVFTSITNVAKCAARMGQSFSSSVHTLNVPFHEVEHIPDIEQDGFCFSDGIGKISKQFARKVALKCRSLSAVPSAFQIRYGGYKGVVAVDPGSSSKLSLRPSMSKFQSSQTGLDVLSWTKPIPCYLNRQVIILLSTLGVGDEVFETMQAKVIEELDRMLEDSTTALEILQTVYAGESHRLMVAMLEAGYEPHLEPYLASLLRAYRDSQILTLRTKSRILVPKGRCLMGCLDEIPMLNYGECFVQVSSRPGAREGWPTHYAGVSGRNCAYVVTGRVVVAKNPCLHPGDVIVLNAVDVPELHHMVDCIVFPQKGPRPHPNECSGSDLDGDLYFVSWDPLLIPEKKVEAMSYEPATAQQLDHPVTLQEIQKFFMHHMLNNSLGVISNAHLVHADREPDKALDSKCLELARLFSIAVDFPKTGVPAVMGASLRPKIYPDFMEKRDKPIYNSTTVLGKLYRSLIGHQNAGIEHRRQPQQEFDKDLIVEGFERYLDGAGYSKSYYDGKLTSLLNQYELSEAEVMSGSIGSLSRFYRKRVDETKERIVMAARALIKEARTWFEKDDDGDENSSAEQRELARASAWYYVTYHPDVRMGLDPKEELLSFPWVVSDRLLKIKQQHNIVNLQSLPTDTTQSD